MKKLLLLILSVLCLALFACAFTACAGFGGSGAGDGDDGDGTTGDGTTVVKDGITYTLNDDETYTVSSVNLESFSVTIEETINDKEVVAIGSEAFRNEVNLKKVVLPSTVVEIGSSAFKDCKKLESINLENVRIIGAEAFKGAISDNSISHTINYPKVTLSNVASLGVMAFNNCAKLREVDMTGASITEIPESCFNGCVLVYTVKLPQSVKTIWKSAFASNSCLVNVNLNYVEYFKASCFENCKNLTSLTLTNCIDIRDKAFYECNKIRTVTLGNKVERIYLRAFLSLPLETFTVGNATDFEYYHFESSNVLNKGAFHKTMPTSVVKEIDIENPAYWAKLVVGHYNVGYFICTQKWMDDNGVKDGDTTVNGYYMSQA